ncbi:hypothetical protein MPDQ_002907 [Monascus purpureus]|uniref:Uncharacterized protein n=1 Tax=Monascus purpureus TaxID=5098 RepID=A0A507QLN0_MONPU|nr:hypothetical protein MPDQ_002907 [Monascus purpureus]BDD59743.1 hypothetical protein MAP00_004935 [Monascus purpureus]
MPLGNPPNPSDIPPKDRSKYRFIQDCGFENFRDFMLSYGLRLEDDDDVKEANAILDSLCTIAQEEWEDERRTYTR